jgi:hypothetical protein
MSSNQQQQGGTGSAESQGRNREEQKTSTQLSATEKQEIASQVDVEATDIADIQQTGAVSGRDDAAGGSGDDMESTSSDEATDRF